ncbi:pleckstrin homology domain-containing family G member 3 isoform X2 [Brienomyrus brachyistius]|uniref:pleckstrin homology domain-containing family G member 3 isoform X2 n=1 Tax=Brienomyrus brachyistius TaxID=42636 RepID=UPI0020B3A0A3|nr:pleckstrin homology domain-containing family G member 3 isoform X2 [Brienomyrus brachyistius]
MTSCWTQPFHSESRNPGGWEEAWWRKADESRAARLTQSSGLLAARRRMRTGRTAPASNISPLVRFELPALRHRARRTERTRVPSAPEAPSAMPEGSHSALYELPMGEESPRLSTASSASSNERASLGAVPDCSAPFGTDPSDGERPVSLVSTLSSGSSRDGHSLCGSAPPPPGDDVDLELSPARGTKKSQQADSRGNRQAEFRRNGSQSAEAVPHAWISPFAAKAMAPNPKLTYVDRVVVEIIETEGMYVRDLRSIVQDYLAHIIDKADLPIRPEHVSALFGNIEDIYEFNSELLQSLNQCDNDPVAIAKCFVDMSEYFTIYTQYCTNYPNSVAALTECMQNKVLAKFFRDRQASLKCSLPLGSYLLKPVQRILKYHLLLQEIAKHFDPEEEGYEVVEEAIDTMTRVAWYINDMKRKHEHAIRLQEIQSLLINWKGPDLTTYGELVLEGTFRIHRAKNERTLFLFDKILLITKKRGEHYEHKSNILCSALMLIDSAKDSLCFSVTRFKYPKQPHTVQAKTVEEKRLWTHHIKRLILENHHAIIPEKAKEAILEMDSIYPTKYRYSPERLKKAVSYSSDEFPGGVRRGRRRSEPAKQIIKSTKAILKHADSEGALQANRRSLQAGASVSTLGSSQGEPEAERPSVEDDDEEPGVQKDSFERLSPSDSEEPRPGAPPCERVEQEDWENNEDDILMGDDQDEDGCEVTGEGSPKQEGGRDEPTEDGNPQEHHAPEGQQQPPSGTPEIGVTEDEMEDASDSEPTDMRVAHENPEIVAASEELRDREEMTECLLVPQLVEAKCLSSGETTQDEDDDEEEEMARDPEPARILPQSVLDQASVIAERFVSSFSRKESLLVEETRSLSCSSPRLNTRSGSASALSLGETFQEPPTPAVDPISSSADNCFELDRGSLRRRDTLSKRDRLLIDKIRTYYEHAEDQDANFSLRRRESLSYIPVGLVRNLSSRLNSIPKEEASVAERKPASNSRTPSWSVFDLPGLENDQGAGAKLPDPNLVVSQSTRLPSQSVSDMPITDDEFRPSSEMIMVWQEMEMEMEVNGDLKEHQDSLKSQKDTYSGPSLSQRAKGGPEAKYSEPLIILEESDLSTISEESSVVSPLKSSKDAEEGKLQIDSLGESLGPYEEGRVPRTPVPRIISLRSELEEDMLQQDMEKMKSKVFQLARQYSQRIKNTRPMVRPRGRDAEVHFLKKNLPSVQEEKLDVEDKGKPTLLLPLNTYEQVILREVHSPSPAHTPTSLGSPHILSPGRSSSRSPLSPVQAESFHWPDVRELRSRYCQRGPSGGPPRLSAVNRSCSVPEKMTDHASERPHGTWRHFSFSSSSSPPVELGQLASGGPQDMPIYRSHSSRGPLGRGIDKLCRSSSLDHRLPNLQDREVPDGYYVSGQASLPNDHKVIVVEKAKSWGGAEKTERKPGEPEGYAHNQLPTSQEEMSIMAVIDRCRAYQESDEYRQREGGEAVASEQLDCPHVSALTTGRKTDNSQQSLVKNLREKFQNMSSNT